MATLSKQARWNARNRDKMREIRQRYERNNREKRLQKSARYKAANIERWRPGGVYYRDPYPYSLREAIRLCGELKREICE